MPGREYALNTRSTRAEVESCAAAERVTANARASVSALRIMWVWELEYYALRCATADDRFQPCWNKEVRTNCFAGFVQRASTEQFAEASPFALNYPHS